MRREYLDPNVQYLQLKPRNTNEWTCYQIQQSYITNFDVVLTMHLSIILVINQPNAQIFVL